MNHKKMITRRIQASVSPKFPKKSNLARFTNINKISSKSIEKNDKNSNSNSNSPIKESKEESNFYMDYEIKVP